MGSGASVEEKHNTRLYKEGYKSLQEGRYTYTKLYFEQAIEKHEGHLFWSSLDPLVDLERRSGKSHSSKKDDDKGDGKQQKMQQEKVDDPNKLPDADGGDDGEGAERMGKLLIEIPLDNRAMDVLEYLQLRGNIVNAYILADRMEEATAHTEYITSHTSVAIKYMRIAREAAVTTNEGGNDDNPLDRRPRHGGFMSGDTERETILECFEQNLRVHWVSAVANSAYASFKKAMGVQGEKKRKKDLDAAVHSCLLTEEAIYNLAKMRPSSAVNEILLRHLESALDDLECISSTGSAPDESEKEKSNAASGSGDDSIKRKGSASVLPSQAAQGNTGNNEDLEFTVFLQRVDRRALCRTIPSPLMEPSLRYVVWLEENLRRLIPGRNVFLQMQSEDVSDKDKKKFLKKQSALKFVADKKPEYNDLVSILRSFDDENALLLFPLLLIQADIQLELGAATKGIQSIDRVEKMTKAMYDPESPEYEALLHHVAESRKRGGALYMMFEDQLLVM